MDFEKANNIKELLMSYSTAHLVTSNLVIGEHFGLFSILESGVTAGLTTQELASRASIKNVRILQEWALCLVSNGFLECIESADGAPERYVLPLETAVCFRKDENIFSGEWPFLKSLQTLQNLQPVIIDKYTTGAGLHWGDLPQALHNGVTENYAPVYEHLLPNWIRLHDIAHCKLETGGLVLDIGCGAGKSTCVLAREYPESKIVGVDYHEASIQKAIKRADHENRKNVSFMVANSESSEWYGSGEVDVVTFFDAFHDMENPGGAAKQAYAALKEGGVVILVEPLSSEADNIADKCSLPVTGYLSAASSHLCTLTALGVDGTGLGLGASCATTRYRQLFKDAGFKSLNVLSMDGLCGPTENGFRVMVVVK